MNSYVIKSNPSTTDNECDITLRGPGLDPAGQHYVFRTEERCQAFINAVNFAYRQGLADGRRQARQGHSEPLVVVSGSHPDALRARPEHWWERARRWMRER